MTILLLQAPSKPLDAVAPLLDAIRNDLALNREPTLYTGYSTKVAPAASDLAPVVSWYSNVPDLEFDEFRAIADKKPVTSYDVNARPRRRGSSWRTIATVMA